ncbi:hypothetical protein BH11BAC5_BH11BAC5_38550 [soil metagenome]
MGYYLRVLGSEDPDIHIDELIEALSIDGLSVNFKLDPNEVPNKWTILEILNPDGAPLAQVERNPVIEGELGFIELNEFREIIQDYQPSTAVSWLTDYFQKVKVIYAFQMLNASFNDGNFEIVASVRSKIWNKTKGILQADHEGFTNADGFHILWQFAEGVTGEWSCAVKNENGQWNNFMMDLGDKIQRQEFKGGNVPKNARLLH